MITLTVVQSWARIETWLARHAPVSHGLLRPPARPEDIAAAELRLGLAFPPDLRESLLRHDGVLLQDGTPTLGYYGPLSGVEDIVAGTEFLRNVGEEASAYETDLDEEERDQYAYWPHERLLITLGIGWQSSDGLFAVTRPGPHHGRIGRYFDEVSPSFTEWPGLRHVLADFATALENGTPFNGRVPLASEGRLIWEDEGTVVLDPPSPLGLAAGTAEPLLPPPAEPVPRSREPTDPLSPSSSGPPTTSSPCSRTSCSWRASRPRNCWTGWARCPRPPDRAAGSRRGCPPPRPGRRAARWSGPAGAVTDGRTPPRRAATPSSAARRCCAGCPGGPGSYG
ncbi:SMI1/KNR4 family protein [Streptomyces sp. NPDC012950]|uniref:SMI1/KNR4 family protein n=1 Tax=Streptomyces sp. NPDC012950 TaxID=3364858 RepID=UPI00367AD7DC